MSDISSLLIFISGFLSSSPILYASCSVLANRICIPGPPLPSPTSSLKNCLIIGDSVSIGYTPWVTKYLESVCQVQHAPWDVSDGGALDTKHGVQCLSMLLSTTSMIPTHYDAIVFNFGLHDVNYNNTFPEEYTPIEEYATNLGLIKDRLLSTGAQVGFITSTPIPYNKTLNNRVKRYNIAAAEVMRIGEFEIELLDLYSWVVMVCGPPPYESCPIARKQPNPHYTEDGYEYLAVYVTMLFKSLLDRGNKSHKYLYKSNHIKKEPNVLCEPKLHYATSCPPQSTCVDAKFSVSGYGCCLLPDATSCDNGRHCCPRRTSCDPSCDMHSCKCISKSN